jgi:hypothetical protein
LRVVWVADRGFTSAENHRYLRRGVGFDGGGPVAQFVGDGGDAVEPAGQQGDAVAVCGQGAGGCHADADDAPVTTATLSGVLLLVIVVRPPGSLGRSFRG